MGACGYIYICVCVCRHLERSLDKILCCIKTSVIIIFKCSPLFYGGGGVGGGATDMF